MQRDYADGVSNDVAYFFGKEVEHTPAYGMHTLFVVGHQSVLDINEMLTNTLDKVTHIFFGANHSFNPANNDYSQWREWEYMIQHFLDKGMLCSLDIPLSAVEQFNYIGLNDSNNFIPQIRVPIPHIKSWNYNTMIKIDDKDFNATNPGVWTHSLHTLQDRSKFTDWSQYKDDRIVK